LSSQTILCGALYTDSHLLSVLCDPYFITEWAQPLDFMMGSAIKSPRTWDRPEMKIWGKYPYPSSSSCQLRTLSNPQRILALTFLEKTYLRQIWYFRIVNQDQKFKNKHFTLNSSNDLWRDVLFLLGWPLFPNSRSQG
jgi:hypothetical protein